MDCTKGENWKAIAKLNGKSIQWQSGRWLRSIQSIQQIYFNQVKLALVERSCELGRKSVVYLAVNGTLMRGLELSGNMQKVGAEFVREAQTEPVYRLWSIGDRHPAMQRVAAGGVAILLEIWAIPPEGISTLLQLEPPGLCIGKVRLSDGEEVLGVLGEAILCEGQLEITQFGGWRPYIMSQSIDPTEFVKQAAALIDLPIPPEYQAGVVENFARIISIAQQVNRVPLPETIEVAPIFQP